MHDAYNYDYKCGTTVVPIIPYTQHNACTVHIRLCNCIKKDIQKFQFLIDGLI